MPSAAAFGELYVASRDRLARQLYALTGDADGAVDLVQEAFARAWARWDRVSRYDDPEAFVRRVAVQPGEEPVAPCQAHACAQRGAGSARRSTRMPLSTRISWRRS